MMPKRPAVLILHHIRKPKSEDKHSGRSLSFLLSGSDALHAAARAVFILQPATDDTDDARTVFTVTKNNNGHFGLRGAWTRHTWFFEEVPEFDWDEYDAGHAKQEPKVKEEHVRALFKDEPWRPRSEAAKQLMQLTGCGRSAAYDALKWNGRFRELLVEHPTHQDWVGLRSGAESGAKADAETEESD
jgi:hypothetical protein